MYALLLNTLLALVWMVAVGSFTLASLLVGFLLGFLVIAVTEPLWGEAQYAPRLGKLVTFLLFFLWELLVSNLRVAADVLTPRLYARPRVAAIPLDARTDTEITLLASFVTLTPGTLVLDVSVDRRTMYIHTMYAQNREQAIAEVKRSFEAHLLEALR